MIREIPRIQPELPTIHTVHFQERDHPTNLAHARLLDKHYCTCKIDSTGMNHFASGSMNASKRPAERYAGDKSESCGVLAPTPNQPVETRRDIPRAEGPKYRGPEQTENRIGSLSACISFSAWLGIWRRQTAQVGGLNPARTTIALYANLRTLPGETVELQTLSALSPQPERRSKEMGNAARPSGPSSRSVNGSSSRSSGPCGENSPTTIRSRLGVAGTQLQVTLHGRGIRLNFGAECKIASTTGEFLSGCGLRHSAPSISENIL